MRRQKYYESAYNICKRLEDKPFAMHLRRADKLKMSELGAIIPHNLEPVTLEFQQCDVMSAVIKDVGDNLAPLVVNPTGKQACGEWDYGAEGFEESLAYRSTLSLSLVDDLYPLQKDEVVYSPNVWAFRGAQWQSIKSFPFSVVSVVPMTRADFSVENDRARFASAFDAVFQVALRGGHKSVILNAFGSREDNNPVEIAHVLGQVLSRYARALHRVTMVFEYSQTNPMIATFRKHVKVVPEEQYDLIPKEENVVELDTPD
jgi:hypothetical protein